MSRLAHYRAAGWAEVGGCQIKTSGEEIKRNVIFSQYVSFSDSYLHKLFVDRPSVVWGRLEVCCDRCHSCSVTETGG